jgi:hypothetical protein
MSFRSGGPIFSIAASLSASIFLAGCTGGPAVLVDTPTGVTPIYTPSPVMPGGPAGPPPGLDGSPPPLLQPVNRDGTYAGTAVPLDTGGGLCVDSRRVGDFRVRGNRARYGGFSGRIAPDGGLQMAYGRDWIIGQFEGTAFHGQLDLNGRFGEPGCTYMLSLGRVGG